MNTKNPSNDNIRIANPMWASCFLTVVFIGDTNNAMYAALERHRRVCDTRWAHKPRWCFLNAKFFKFVLPGLLAGVINLIAEVVTRNLS